MPIPSSKTNRLWLYLTVGAMGAAVFWALRPLAIQSGDARGYSFKPIYGESRPIYHVREPGAVLIWQGIVWSARALEGGSDKPARLTPEERELGFSLMGAASGGVFLVCLLGLLFEVRPRFGRGHLLAMAVVLASAVTWNFVGHIEFYSIMFASLIFYYWRAVRYFRTPDFRNFVILIVAALVAVTVHRAAVFHLPALALVFRSGNPDGGWRKPERRESLVALGGVIALCVIHLIPVLTFMFWNGPFIVQETNNSLAWLLTPWTQSWELAVRDSIHREAWHLFRFGTMEHWKHFFFFMGVGAPVGAIVSLALAKRIRYNDERFLALAAAGAWLWALLWHPHIGLADWDLFSNPALPTNLLAAVLILRWSHDSPSIHDAAGKLFVSRDSS